MVFLAPNTRSSVESRTRFEMSEIDLRPVGKNTKSKPKNKITYAVILRYHKPAYGKTDQSIQPLTRTRMIPIIVLIGLSISSSARTVRLNIFPIEESASGENRNSRPKSSERSPKKTFFSSSAS